MLLTNYSRRLTKNMVSNLESKMSSFEESARRHYVAHSTPGNNINPRQPTDSSPSKNIIVCQKKIILYFTVATNNIAATRSKLVVIINVLCICRCSIKKNQTIKRAILFSQCRRAISMHGFTAVYLGRLSKPSLWSVLMHDFSLNNFH